LRNVAAVIRLCYFPGSQQDALFARRLQFFKDQCLPRLMRQTVHTDVWVWVHPRHMQMAKMAFAVDDVHLFMVDLRSMSVRFADTQIRGYPWSAVRGMPRYQHQVLLGSDDLLGPEFVSLALQKLSEIDDPRASARSLVSHRPRALHMPTMKCYAMPRWNTPSPFVVLKQHEEAPNYTWVWAHAHNRLHMIVDTWAWIDGYQALMCINADNDGTRFDDNWTEVDRPSWL
jgi:hypothetical protein